MKCMYAQTRPRFILSSEGVLGGMEFEPMLTPREKSPLPKMSPEEDRTRDAVDSEPKHYQLSYSGPRMISILRKRTRIGRPSSTRSVLWNQGTNESVLTRRPRGGVVGAGWLLNVPATTVPQGPTCSDNCTCCHAETQVADQTSRLTQSQYTDTGPASPSADPTWPGGRQGSHWSTQFLSH